MFYLCVFDIVSKRKGNSDFNLFNNFKISIITNPAYKLVYMVRIAFYGKI